MIFDRYLFRNLLVATVFIAITLATIILLTQSLRFLELVMNSGASSMAFLNLALLALPRFFEVILPIALMMAIIFVYNRMTIDSEIVVMRSLGASPMALARPALILSGLTAIILLLMTSWLAPLSLSNMHHTRQLIKAQYSTLLFRRGIFNSIGSGLTVFVRDRNSNGELLGLIIHDSRKANGQPTTILAKRGVVVITPKGQQVVVYNGSRQSMNKQSKTLDRLNFQRYTIDLPEDTGIVHQRWRKPDERTLKELLNPDLQNKRDRESKRAFMVEIHRRIVSPFLAPAFAVMTLFCLLLGPIDRRGQNWRIALAVLGTVVIQGLYLAAFNLARRNGWGLFLMYCLVFIPLTGGTFFLSPFSESIKQRLFSKRRPAL